MTKRRGSPRGRGSSSGSGRVLRSSSGSDRPPVSPNPSLYEGVRNGLEGLLSNCSVPFLETVLKEVKKTRLAAPKGGADELGNTPSDLTDYSVWKQYQGKVSAEARYLCYRPEFAVPPLPLTLVCKAFASFRQDVREGQPERVDVDFAEEFWHKLQDPSYVTDHRETVQTMVQELIFYYLDAYVVPYFLLQSRVEADGLLFEKKRVKLLLEFKSQAGSCGDPDMQSLDCFLRACTLMGVNVRQYALVVCMLGPRVEVWAATVDSGKVWAEPLAESKCYGREEYLISTAKIWRAIRLFVQEGYEDVPLVSPPIPWPLSKESNVERLDKGKLVFVYLNDDGETEVGKFVSRYSIEAHKAWVPFAPKIQDVVQVCDTFWLVRMEYLSPEQGWLPGGEVVKKIRADSGHVAKLAGCIGAALDAGHSKGFVHGDLRLCNIVVRPSYEMEDGYPKYEVKILDFDWSGKLGEAVYPRMNKRVSWPPGAEYGAHISKAHDIYFKNHLVEQLEDVTALESVETCGRRISCFSSIAAFTQQRLTSSKCNAHLTAVNT